MSLRVRVWMLAAILFCLSLTLLFNPRIDLITSSWFFDGHDFDWKLAPVAVFLHELVLPVGYTLAAIFLAMGVSRYRRSRMWKPYLFLLLSLIIGPGLITNTLLKDNWDRARPQQVEEFGGSKKFTPPLVMAKPSQCPENCSFVSGDAAFAFWFHAFAYVVTPRMPRRRRHQFFWGGVVLGSCYGILRVGMGAHFFSDVIFAGVFMMLSTAAVYASIFGQRALAAVWTELLGCRPAQQVAH